MSVTVTVPPVSMPMTFVSFVVGALNRIIQFFVQYGNRVT